MRKFLFGLILIPVLSFSQECLYLENGKDIFTGDVKKQTDWKKFLGKLDHTASAGILSINDNQYLRITHFMQSVFSMVEGNRIIFLDKDNNTYVFRSIETEVADYTSYGYSTSWSATIDYSIEEGQLEQLLDKEMKSVRIYFQDGYLEYDIKNKKNRKALSHLAYCMTQLLQQ